MPSRGYLQQFTFGRREGVQDLLDMESDCSSLTDECDSNDSDSLDFGSVTFKDDVAAQKAEVEDEDEQNGDEWDEDEFPPLDLNEEALKHVASQYLPGDHGRCVDICTMPRGSNHEIRLLSFEDGWSCIGRFVRSREEPLAVLESEVATRDYVRKHTSIPVPETYFLNPDPNHVVGAAFVLMERIEATQLCKIWDDLSLEHKTAVIAQIAHVVLQLAELKFDRIGSLKADGSVGALNDCYVGEGTNGPFSTTEAYLLGDAPSPSTCSDEVKALNNEFKTRLFSALRKNKDSAALKAPYRLIHTNFDAQNMLFTHPDPTDPPKLVAIIDWDNAHTGLLYELMEYPIVIQDVEWSPELFESNKVLRKHFGQCLAHGYPKGSKERDEVKQCFRSKEWVLSNFRDMWVLPEGGEEGVSGARVRLERLKEETAFPYDGVADWEPDSEVESESEDEGEA